MKRLGGLLWLERAAVALTIAAAAVPLLLTARLALRWRIMHDAPIMLYLADMVGRFHRVPYRDLFDMNTPGVYPAYALLAALTGGSDAGLRAADLALVALQMAAMAYALRPFGWRAACVGPLLHGLAMLDLAVFHALQRESLALAAVAVAVALLSPRAPGSRARRGTLAALALGVACTLKPGFALDALPFAAWLAWEHRAGEPRPRELAAAAVAFVAPWCALLAWLALAGGLGPFVDIVRNYWPLYARLGALHETLSDAQRPGYLLQGLAALGGHRLWFAAALVACLWTLRGVPAGRERRFVGFAGGLLLAHALLPAVSGQFWPYHWFPLLWSLAFVSAFALWPGAGGASAPQLLRRLAVIAAVAAALRVPAPLARAAAGLPDEDPYAPRVREIAAFLEQHQQPGDLVQPLDWTGGAVDAMWRAHSRLATPFVYDFHFHHHVSTEYVQSLRARFLAAFEATRPRFVIAIETRKPWPIGPDTSHDWNELDLVLRRDYQLAAYGEGYRILVRSR